MSRTNGAIPKAGLDRQFSSLFVHASPPELTLSPSSDRRKLLTNRRRKPLVNRLTDSRLQGLQNAGRGREIDQTGGASGRDFVVDTPFLDVPVLIDMGGGPD